MANNCVYYFEVPRAYNDGIDIYPAGTYSARGYMGGFVGWQSRLSWNCSRVWCQGPRGGVQLFWFRKSIGKSMSKYKYVTNNAELMQQFAWIKLSARPLEM